MDSDVRALRAVLQVVGVQMLEPQEPCLQVVRREPWEELGH